MLAVASVLIVATVSLLITRVATLALVLTGLSQEAARFQARSALTGTGFTTAEAESVVGHPVRRKIVMFLMMLGGAGLVTTIAALVIGFANASQAQAFTRLAVLLAALWALLAISRTRWFDRAIGPLLARIVNRHMEIEAGDYAEFLHLGGEWSIGQLAVQDDDWVACKRLRDIDLRAEGVAVLGIERADGTYLGAPDFSTQVEPGDVLLLYGHAARLRELDDRPSGEEGDAAHAAAVAARREADAGESA